MAVGFLLTTKLHILERIWGGESHHISPVLELVVGTFGSIELLSTTSWTTTPGTKPSLIELTCVKIGKPTLTQG